MTAKHCSSQFPKFEFCFFVHFGRFHQKWISAPKTLVPAFHVVIRFGMFPIHAHCANWPHIALKQDSLNVAQQVIKSRCFNAMAYSGTPTCNKLFLIVARSCSLFTWTIYIYGIYCVSSANLNRQSRFSPLAELHKLTYLVMTCRKHWLIHQFFHVLKCRYHLFRRRNVARRAGRIKSIRLNQSWIRIFFSWKNQLKK